MRRVLCITWFVLSLLGGLAACGSPKPAGDLQGIQQTEVIKVGTSADYPPFEYIDNSGDKAGFDIALMEEIARRLGVRLEWVDMPFDRLSSAVQVGKIDAAISAINSSQADTEMVSFSDPYYLLEDAAGPSPMRIVLRKDDPVLAARINKVIGELIRDGTIKQLAIQYLAGGE